MQELLIQSLRTDGLQIRPSLDKEHVAALAKVLQAEKKFKDDIIVFKDKARALWVADGHHRIAAHVAIGQANIRCDLRKGEFCDALKYALSANADHGKRRDDETVANAIRIAYEKRAIIGLADVPSAKAVALLVKCSDTWVTRQLSAVESWRGAIKRTGTDGKERAAHPLPPTGKKITPPPPNNSKQFAVQKCPPPPPQVVTPPPSTSRPPPPPGSPRKPTPPPERLDGVGKPIPDHLWPAWDRGDEMAEMGKSATRMANIVEKYQHTEDPILLDGNGQSIVAALKSAAHSLKSNVPYAVCPYCRGVIMDNCRACKGKGIVGKHFYDNAIPSTVKT